MNEPTLLDGKPIRYLPGYPPEDYTGTQSDWMIALQQEGLWDGTGSYQDVAVPVDTYWRILEQCEKS